MPHVLRVFSFLDFHAKNGVARKDLEGYSLRGTITRRDGANAIPSEAELDASREAWFAHLLPDQDLWIFAYGSLVWNPIFPVAGHRRTHLNGFHRSFCMASTIGRGSSERPGLILALERGGSVDGVAFKMGWHRRDMEIRLLRRREMLARIYEPVWTTILTDKGPVAALTFVADQHAANYVGQLPLTETAKRIVGAAGLLGTNLDYLESRYCRPARLCRRRKEKSRFAAAFFFETLAEAVGFVLASETCMTTTLCFATRRPYPDSYPINLRPPQ